MACTPSRSSRGGAGHREQHAGLRVLALARERLALAAARDARAAARTPWIDADGARQLAFQRAGLVDLLLELGGRQAVAAVEDLVADRAAGRQALARQQHAGARHLVGRHQDLVALGRRTGRRCAGGRAGPRPGQPRAGRDRRRAAPSARCRRAAPGRRAARACPERPPPSRRAAPARAPSGLRGRPSSRPCTAADPSRGLRCSVLHVRPVPWQPGILPCGELPRDRLPSR